MGFDDLVDCSSFVSAAIRQVGQVGYSFKEASHAIGELSKAVGAYSYAEGSSSSLSCRQPTGMIEVIKMSIVRKGSLPERQTTTLTVDNAKINWDVLENNFGPFNTFNEGDVIFYK